MIAVAASQMTRLKAAAATEAASAKTAAATSRRTSPRTATTPVVPELLGRAGVGLQKFGGIEFHC